MRIFILLCCRRRWWRSCGLSMNCVMGNGGEAAEIEGIGEVLVDLFGGWVAGKRASVLLDIASHVGQAWSGREGSLGEGGCAEAVDASGFGFITIYGKNIVAPAAGMGDIISATTDGAAVPGVHDIKGHGGIDADRRV